ncbi:MAG TPA: XdhC family protein [Solirubrobacteraceae bacterium]
MNSVLEAIREWLARGERVAVATVVDTKKSAPQPAGTKMGINELGEVVGAVSGGCVEGAVVEIAELIIDGAAPQLLHYGIADEDAWDVGLPCGGEITVWVQTFTPDDLQGRFTELERVGARAALVTVVEDSSATGQRMLVLPDGDPEGSLGNPELDAAAAGFARDALWTERSELREHAGTKVFVDVVAPPPRLIVVGAVDFAAQLCEVARIAGWRPFVIDPRARFATEARFPAAERVIVAWPEEGFAQLDPIDLATAIAVLTHDPKLDDAALGAALSSEAFYIGAMGSRRAQARRRDRLLAAGIDAELLDRVSAPIGLDLGALTAAETALSIMSEIVALRHGRPGGRLIGASGRIHDVVAA